MRWSEFDSTLADLWRFLVPPVLNAGVIFLAFPVLLRQLGRLFAWVSETAQGTIEDLGPGVVKEYSELIARTIGAVGDGGWQVVVVLIIGLFVVNQLVLITGGVFFGRIDLKEEELDRRPLLANLFTLSRSYIPHENLYSKVNRQWDYARTVNDATDNLENYKTRRRQLLSNISKARDYATYSSAYFLISLCSLVVTASTPISDYAGPSVVLILSVPALLYFAMLYGRRCEKLVELDLTTFLAVCDHAQLPTNPPPRPGRHRHPQRDRYGEFQIVELFRGNLITRIKKLIKLVVASLTKNTPSVRKSTDEKGP